eukprot:comp14131_c0_seq1/m.20117 comp14131_c0_seq1/g.20117  ORF comp14131_c0_seq1/g.20117 comp14131_c0_seq1/m.20117 type:complete len:193 (-) comp14131_c0_seq1:21-599(-)
MKVTSGFLRRFHLDKRHSLLSARSLLVLREYFEVLDVRRKESLDDIQFLSFIKTNTDLSEAKSYGLFDIFDIDGSGSVDFDEFYLMVAMLIAVKDNEEKRFLHYHSRTCFELLDQDGSKTVSAAEFKRFGFLFNFSTQTVNNIFKDFDITGDKELDFEEFRMFTLAAIDRQKELDEARGKKKAGKKQQCRQT